MLKKISVTQLQVQMYIHKMSGPRIDSPFWHKSFKLEDHATLDRICASSITRVWIDIAKGVDVLTNGVVTSAAIRSDAAQAETTQKF